MTYFISFTTLLLGICIGAGQQIEGKTLDLVVNIFIASIFTIIGLHFSARQQRSDDFHNLKVQLKAYLDEILSGIMDDSGEVLRYHIVGKIDEDEVYTLSNKGRSLALNAEFTLKQLSISSELSGYQKLAESTQSMQSIFRELYKSGRTDRSTFGLKFTECWNGISKAKIDFFPSLRGRPVPILQLSTISFAAQ